LHGQDQAVDRLFKTGSGHSETACDWRHPTRKSYWHRLKTDDCFVAQSRQILKSVVGQLVGQFQTAKLVEAGAG